MGSVRVDVLLERMQPGLPAFVVVPAARVAHWKLAATTTVEATLDGVPLGRRSLLRGDRGRWFVELRREHLRRLGKSPGDRAVLVLARASTRLPAELRKVIDTVPAARDCWKRLTGAQRRMLREEILAAKAPATRERRARRALLPSPTPGKPAALRSPGARVVAAISARRARSRP